MGNPQFTRREPLRRSRRTPLHQQLCLKLCLIEYSRCTGSVGCEYFLRTMAGNAINPLEWAQKSPIPTSASSYSTSTCWILGEYLKSTLGLARHVLLRTDGLPECSSNSAAMTSKIDDHVAI